MILKFIDILSQQIVGQDPSKLEDSNLKHFVCATIRVLGAWLSEETATMREEVKNKGAVINANPVKLGARFPG